MSKIVKKTLNISTQITMSIMNYNVSSSSNSSSATPTNRINAVCRIIAQENPDIIGLHDINSECLEVFEGAFSENYHIIQAFRESGEKFGSVLVFKRDKVKLVGDPYYYPLSTTHVIGCGVEVEHKNFHVLAINLDPLAVNEINRIEQLQGIKEIIKPFKQCVLLGCFEITTQFEQDKIDDLLLHDAWNLIGYPNSIKNTRNQHKKSKSSFNIRPDRILISSMFKVKKIKHVGIRQISYTLPVFPSDHAGIVIDAHLA